MTRKWTVRRRLADNDGLFHCFVTAMLIQLLAAIPTVVFVHLAATALAAYELGIAVRWVTFGIGPTVFRAGRLRIAALPLGGEVRLALLDDLEAGESTHRALDAQPRWKHVFLTLSGPLALLGLGATLFGDGALRQFAGAFVQLPLGALDPFGYAHTLLDGAGAVLTGRGWPAVVGVIACKIAAMNLLPIAVSNAMGALRAVVPSGLSEALDDGPVLRAVMLLCLLLALLMSGSWLLACLTW